MHQKKGWHSKEKILWHLGVNDMYCKDLDDIYEVILPAEITPPMSAPETFKYLETSRKVGF